MVTTPRDAKAAGPERDPFLELVRAFPLRPIRSDEGHRRAIEMMDSLIDHGAPTEEVRDYKLVLASLIESYEDDREPTPGASPAEILRGLIEDNDMSQARLAEETGVSETTISDILSGRRPISRKAALAFADRFRLDPGLFF